MNEFDRFEVLLWLIDRFDSLRASVNNNGAIVISANALIIAAITFLVGTIVDPTSFLNLNLKITAILCCAASLIFSVISVYFSVNAIANVFKTSRQLIRTNVPTRYFLNQRETLEKWDSFDVFAKDFRSMDAEKFLELGIAELWAISVTQNKRYSSLRWSIRFFVAAMPPFVIAVGIVLVAAL